MAKIQKLFKHGTGFGVTVPRSIRTHLGWLPGDAVIVEELADQSIRVRRPQLSDFVPVVSESVNDPRLPRRRRQLDLVPVVNDQVNDPQVAIVRPTPPPDPDAPPFVPSPRLEGPRT